MALWASIPGETPIDDISGLKIKGISTRAELNVHEANNIRIAVVKYLAKKPSKKSAPFDYSWCLKLHQEMFGNVWQWAGRLRRSSKTIGVEPHQIEPQLFDLLKCLELWEQTDPVVLQATMLHHRAVQIHPFENGNGRWSRLLANIWLKQHKHPIVLWPEETIGDASTVRGAYLDAIKKADDGDCGPLLALHEKYLSDRTE